MRVIPAIDIIEGKCVRLSKGDYDTKKVYNENPLEVAKAFGHFLPFNLQKTIVHPDLRHQVGVMSTA